MHTLLPLLLWSFVLGPIVCVLVACGGRSQYVSNTRAIIATILGGPFVWLLFALQFLNEWCDDREQI